MLIYLDVLLTTEGIRQCFIKDVVSFEQKDPRSRKTKATGLSHLKRQLSQCLFDTLDMPTGDQMASHPYFRVCPESPNLRHNSLMGVPKVGTFRTHSYLTTSLQLLVMELF